jgi:peptide/nickel transport system substrate-binding protein
MQFSKRLWGAVGIAAACALALSGCGRSADPAGTPASGGADAAGILVGTTDKATTLDPAGSYDHGSMTINTQVYSFLYSFTGDASTPQPDAADSCAFLESDGSIFQCKIKEGLKFANGHALTASDVKFSFQRVLDINSDQGPASLLTNLESIEVVDDLTVNFKLTSKNDQTFEQVLATNTGPIVDEEVFSGTELTPDKTIVDANAFSGPYTITSFALNDTVELTPYADYKGAHGKPANSKITLKTFTDSTNLQLAITQGTVDVVYRSLTPTDIETLQKNSDVKVWQKEGGEIRYMVFNLNTMPGDTPAQKLAVRKAVASSIDREALSTNVYKGQYTPLCSYVPEGYIGANTAVCDLYGTTPDKDKAAKFLSDAGVATPVALNIQYNPDHYGSSSADEYGLIKQQLEASGLFTVNLQGTEWTTYQTERTSDAYPIYQLGWFPDFPDGDNYLTPFFAPNNFVKNHFEDAAGADEIFAAIADETSDVNQDNRAKTIEQIQEKLAADILPNVPLLRGSQWAVSRANVDGIKLMTNENLSFVSLSKK